MRSGRPKVRSNRIPEAGLEPLDERPCSDARCGVNPAARTPVLSGTVCLAAALLGVVTTVAVAWAWYVRPKAWWPFGQSTPASGRSVHHEWTDQFGSRANRSMSQDGFSFWSLSSKRPVTGEERRWRSVTGGNWERDSHVVPWWLRRLEGDGDFLVAGEQRAGWPASSLSAAVVMPSRDGVDRPHVLYGLEVRGLRFTSGGDWIHFPIIPLWPGFLINAGLYGFTWLLVLRGRTMVREVRYRLNEQHAVCDRCGYDLRGLRSCDRVCPECGASRTEASSGPGGGSLARSARRLRGRLLRSIRL